MTHLEPVIERQRGGCAAPVQDGLQLIQERQRTVHLERPPPQRGNPSRQEPR